MRRCRKRQAKRPTRPGKGVKTHFKKRTPGPAAPDPASPSLLLSLFLLHPANPLTPPSFLRALLGPPFLPSKNNPSPKPWWPHPQSQRNHTQKNQNEKSKVKKKGQNPCGRGLPGRFLPLSGDSGKFLPMRFCQVTRGRPPLNS